MEHKDSFLNAIICIFGIAYSIARMQAEHFFLFGKLFTYIILQPFFFVSTFSFYLLLNFF